MSVKKYTTKKGDLWEGFAYCGTDELTGREIREHKKGFKTKKEAEKWVENIRVSHRRGEIKRKCENKTITFKEAGQLWLDQHKLTIKESTLLDIQGILKRHIYPQLGQYKINKIMPVHCQKAVNYYYKAVGDHKRLVNYTNHIFQFALKLGYIKENPMSSIEIQKRKRSDIIKKKTSKSKVLTKKEIDKLLKASKEISMTKNNSRWFFPFVYLSLFSGTRSQETRALEWSSMHLIKKEGFINIEKAFSCDLKQRQKLSTTKNETSNAIINISDDVVDVILDWKLEQTKWMFERGKNINTYKKQFVFLDDRLLPISYSMINSRLEQACNLAKIKVITPHSLRHTHCTELLNAGVQIKDVQKRLRHASSSTTLEYYAHANENQQEIADVFSRHVTSHVTN